VTARIQCPRCGARKSWLLKNGRRRCARCRRDWRPGRLPLRLSAPQWRALLRWFVRGAPSAEIARETGLGRKRVLRALLVVRRAMLRTALGSGRRVAPQRSATPRAAVATLGLLVTADGRVWAEVVPALEAEQFGDWLRARNGRRSPTRHSHPRYTAVVYRGRLHRLADAGAARVPFGRVEAFWAYLQRQLRATGGIRRERLGLYLAGYAWRYNHRTLSPAEQLAAILTLIRQPRKVD